MATQYNTRTDHWSKMRMNVSDMTLSFLFSFIIWHESTGDKRYD